MVRFIAPYVLRVPFDPAQDMLRVFVVKDRMGNPAILPDPSYNYCFAFFVVIRQVVPCIISAARSFDSAALRSR